MRKVWILAHLLLSLLAGAVQAQETWYQIEVIVFEHLTTPPDALEHWPLTPGYPTIGTAIDFPDEDTEQTNPNIDFSAAIADEDAAFINQSEIVTLTAEQKTLSSAWQHMKRSADYHPLQYLAWRQTRTSADAGLSVHLKVGGVIDPDSGQSTPVLIDGWIKLIRSVYLHVETDLAYFLDNRPDAYPFGVKGEGGYAEMVRLHEKRKLRYNELHYLDHPLFGVVVRVSPVDLEAEMMDFEEDPELVQETIE